MCSMSRRALIFSTTARTGLTMPRYLSASASTLHGCHDNIKPIIADETGISRFGTLGLPRRQGVATAAQAVLVDDFIWTGGDPTATKAPTSTHHQRGVEARRQAAVARAES